MSESSGGPEDLHALLLPAREETPAKINHTARDLSRGPQHEGLGPGSPLIPGYPQKGWHSMQSLWPGNSRAVWAGALHTASHRLHSPFPSPPVPSYKPIYSKITRALHFKQQAARRQWPDREPFQQVFSGGHRPGLCFRGGGGGGRGPGN